MKSSSVVWYSVFGVRRALILSFSRSSTAFLGSVIRYSLLSIFLGLGGMIGWGIYDFLGGVFAKQIGPFKSFFWSQLAGLLSIFLLAFVFTINLDASIQVIVLSAIAAIFYAAGYLFFFKGFEIGNVSIVAATMNLWAVFTMLFAFIFMGQRLSTIKL